MSDIGKRIRAKRMDRGLTQQRVSEMMGVVMMTVSRWERGATTPSPRMLWMLSRVLHCDVSELTGERQGEPGEVRP